MDLKGAYTLIDVHPDEVGMFAQELVDTDVLPSMQRVQVVMHSGCLSGGDGGH
jgi:hypothetical protein